MIDEVLRMSNVTYKKNGMTYLQNFELSVESGQIMGLLVIDGFGEDELVSTLMYNDSLYNGCVYYCGKNVNSWRQFPRKRNRITLIGERSSLIREQNALTNIFVLRPGMHKEVLDYHVMEQAFYPIMKEAGLAIDPCEPVAELSAYEQTVLELLKGIIENDRLIIAQNVDSVLSDEDLDRFGRLMQHFSKKGTSFIYISAHLETLMGICSQIGIMKQGSVVSILGEENALKQSSLFYSAEFTGSVRRRALTYRLDQNAPEAFRMQHIHLGKIRDFTFSVKRGECLCLQFLDTNVYNRIESSLLNGEGTIRAGTLEGAEGYVDGKRVYRMTNRDIAVLSKHPEEDNLFYDLSFFDNIGITMDFRYPSVWRSRKAQKSIRQELENILGVDLWDKDIALMSRKEKYYVLFSRLILQKPKIVVEFTPFLMDDVNDRYEIFKINEELLGKGISVIFVSLGLADSLALADRLIRVGTDGNWEEYGREDFGKLSEHIPWISLYQSDRGRK